MCLFFLHALLFFTIALHLLWGQVCFNNNNIATMVNATKKLTSSHLACACSSDQEILAHLRWHSHSSTSCEVGHHPLLQT